MNNIAIGNKKNGDPRPFRFYNHEYLRPLYEARDYSSVYRKAAQVGITTYFLIKNLYLAAAYKAQTLYVLPNTRLLNSFVTERLGKLLRESEIGTQVEYVDNVAVKDFAGGILRFASSMNRKDLISHPTDFAFVDEVDECFNPHLPLVEKRLGHAMIFPWSDKLHRGGLAYGSTPTMPGYGIDYLYKQGSRNLYYQRCGCGEWQSLKFVGNIVREVDTGMYELLDKKWNPDAGRDANVLCIKCGKPIDRFVEGEWRSEYPKRAVKSWHISRLYSPFASIAGFWETWLNAKYNPDALAEFWRSDLGIPFVSADSICLDDAMLNKAICEIAPINLKAYDTKYRPGAVYVGTDVGAVIHTVVLAPRAVNGVEQFIVVWAGEHRTFDSLARWIYDLLKPNKAAIDALPETHSIRGLQESYRFLWACLYPTSEFEKAWVRLDDEKRFANIDRTQAMDEVLAGISSGRIKFHRAIRGVIGFFDQLKAPVRSIEKRTADREKSGASPRVVWREGSNPDHYFHALVYAYTAAWIGQRRPSLVDNVDLGGVKRIAADIVG